MEVKKFRTWLIDNNLESDLFLEAIKCYQVDAYKAAFFYSYLGFIEFIKEVIISHKGVPQKFAEKNKEKGDIENLWRERIKRLDSEDNWEEETLNFINEDTKTNIFLLKNNIRNEFIQKKNLRNVCVHNKKREIASATVEVLWDFIKYSKPYFVINGSLETLKDQFSKVVKFANKEEYNKKISEIYEDYVQLQVSDKKIFFDFIIQHISDALVFFDYSELDCIDIMLHLIFNQTMAEEYEWIDSIGVKIYCSSNVDTYKNKIDSDSLKEFAYENANQFLGILIIFTSDFNINQLLKDIYLEKKEVEWWSMLNAVTSSRYAFHLSDDLIELIDKKCNVEYIYQNYIKKLYSYKTGYGKEHTTVTFDYRNFPNYSGYVKVLLQLIKQGKYNFQNKNELIEHCKELMNLDYNDENIYSNYNEMYDFFKRDKILFEWLKSI